VVDSRNPPKNLAEKRAASPVRQTWPLMSLQQKLIGAGVMRCSGNWVRRTLIEFACGIVLDLGDCELILQ
jgi:hypothetical protein